MKGRKQVQTSQSPAGAKGTAKLSVPSQAKKSSHGLANPSFRKTSQLFMSKTMMESKARLHAASRGPRRRDEDGFRDGDYDDAEGDYLGPRELIKPHDQLELTEQELKEELTRVLTADNPHAPANIVRYSFKEQTFKPIPTIDQLAVHFSMDSTLLHKDSDEARRQLDQLEGGESSESESEGDEEEGESDDKKESEEGGEGDAPAEGEAKKKSGKPEKRLRNQFNFSERASQTLNNPYRDRGTATEPPPRANFSANANQMEIFDAYVQDLIAQEKAKEKKTGGGAKGGASTSQSEEKPKGASSEIQSDDLSRVAGAAKIMERMVNQNTFDDIAQDFKYYEDPGDDFRDSTGQLLPLWRFKYEKARKSAVTALSWNPLYKDLFAVGHGSYEFSGQHAGYICLHSLKNPTFPEYVFGMTSGVMCLDIHPENAFLVAVGLYDGKVAVYDFREAKNPVFQSDARTGKHTDPVWQVCWQNNDMDGNMNFYSVSSDGRVVNWKLVKNELQCQDAVLLKIPGASVDGPEGTQQQALSSGTSIGFNPFNDHLFLVGTEEGQIYKCSKAYTSHYLDIYQAHHMAVHAIRWSPFHQNVFASCGADWTVKIWDHTRKDPMFTFDLSNVVGDVAWSPYCATVFAAVTTEGKVYIYDLNINKYEPLCVQTVIQKKNTKLTHVAFNPIHPVLIVGDDRGTVLCLKLSPNLRKALKEKTYSKENEVAKMEKLITFVREPLLEKEQDTSSS